MLTLVLVSCTDIDVGSFETCEPAHLTACIVVRPECCEDCAPATVGEVIAVRANALDEFRSALECDVSPHNPNLQARCEAAPDGTARCTPFDLRTDPDWAGCTTAAECRVRTADCCECMPADWSHENLVAAGPGFPGTDRICSTACAGCLPVPPDDVAAVCTDNLCALAPR